jgi:hypothetical protein
MTMTMTMTTVGMIMVDTATPGTVTACRPTWTGAG